MNTTADIRWDFETQDLRRAHREISRRLKPYSMETDIGGEYRARMCHRRLRATDLTLIEYGGAVAIEAGRMKDFWLLHVPLSGHYSVRSDHQKRQIGFGYAHLVHPQMRLSMECSADCRLLVLRLDKPHSTSLAFPGWRNAEAQEVGHVLSLQEGNGKSLGHILDYVVRELTEGVLLEQRPSRCSSLEDLLLSSLSLTLDPRPTGNGAPRPYYVRRAEKYILENLVGDLELAGVVDASGVSARTLFRGFQSIHCQGPIGWAREQRLERARDDLLAAIGKPRISDIALRWGFTHLGRFCAAYRARYGQTPSESLRTRS